MPPAGLAAVGSVGESAMESVLAEVFPRHEHEGSGEAQVLEEGVGEHETASGGGFQKRYAP